MGLGLGDPDSILGSLHVLVAREYPKALNLHWEVCHNWPGHVRTTCLEAESRKEQGKSKGCLSEGFTTKLKMYLPVAFVIPKVLGPVGETVDPSVIDAIREWFAKVFTQLGERQRLSLHAQHSSKVTGHFFAEGYQDLLPSISNAFNNSLAWIHEVAHNWGEIRQSATETDFVHDRLTNTDPW